MGAAPLVPGNAAAIPSSRQFQFQVAGVQPPVLAYVGPGEFIQVMVNNSVAAPGFAVCMRLLMPDGQIKYAQWTPTLVADRSRNSFFFPLDECCILSCQVFATGATQRGQLYARVFVCTGTLGPPGAVLFSGYVHGGQEAAYPAVSYEDQINTRGFVRSIVGTTPGAGADISETVPTNAIWLLKTFRYQLTTSVAVANRTTVLIIDDGANILSLIEAAVVQAASLTRAYSHAESFQRTPFTAAEALQPLPSDLVLLPGWRIRTSTTNIQAADQYTSPFYSVEEFLQV